MPVSTERRKRGRKPKGGKVVTAATASAAATTVSQNIILHLLCSTSDVAAIEVENTTQDSQLPEGVKRVLSVKFANQLPRQAHQRRGMICGRR